MGRELTMRNGRPGERCPECVEASKDECDHCNGNDTEEG